MTMLNSNAVCGYQNVFLRFGRR